MSKSSLSDLETKLVSFFRLVPSLPSNTKNLIVDYGPYFVLIAGILAILSSGILNLFIVGWAPKTYEFSIYNYYLQIIFDLIAAAVLVLSFKPLQKKQFRGWRILFYLMLLEVVLFIFTINVFGLALCLLTFYLLFQVKERYN
jgi:hypothetical protein